ncbi:MAG TPA: RNA polymerase sigma-70 factor [Spongiibacteraceae bacterium]|nr:RNA polymerase sigma-70 factor [Spongiibacteraceae bacterium]
MMENALDIFAKHRPRLFGIAYRMLGARSDADDILQEAYLRWAGIDIATVENAEAWLVTATTRLCIDRLRAAKAERAAYTGPWLPEPMVAIQADEAELTDSHSPETAATLASEISLAFLLVLERLAPEERAAFLLREAFDFDYDEIANILGKSASACRQIVHRAKERVQQARPRFDVAPGAHKQLLESFVEAVTSGDTHRMLKLFATDAKMFADGGGKVTAALRVLQGNERLVRLYQAIGRNSNGTIRFEFAEVNGELGLLHYNQEQLASVYSFVTDGKQILEIYAVRNPDKLTGVVKKFH